MILNLRQTLFLSVSGPLSLGLLVCILAAIIPLYAHVKDWNDSTNEAIRYMNIAASGTRLSKLNEHLQVVYSQINTDMATLRNDSAIFLQGTRLPASSSFRTYYADPSGTIDPSVPASDDYYFGGFPRASGVWKAGTTALSQLALDPYTDKSAMFDIMWKGMYKASFAAGTRVNSGGGASLTPFYQLIQVGFETNLYRSYPWARYPAAFQTRNYCAEVGELTWGVSYQPRCRSWYRDVVAGLASGVLSTTGVSYTSPYVDASTGMSIISASTPLFNLSGDGSFIGVLGIDLDMSVIDSVVTTAHISNSGYVFLMDESGSIISHPRWNRATNPTITVQAIEPTFAPGFWTAILAAGSVNLGPYMVPGYTNGVGSAQDVTLLAITNTLGRAYYVEFTRNPDTNFVLVTLFPQDDLADDESSSLSSLKGLVTPGVVGLCIVLVFLWGLILWGTHKIALYYSRALKDAALVLEQATKPDLQVQLGMRDPVCYEINLLFEQFQPMLVAINFANDSYYDNNLDKALRDYQLAEQLMLKQNNQKGLAKVANNQGNVYLRKGDFPQAKRYYNQAIDIGQKMLRECEADLVAAEAAMAAAIAQADQQEAAGGAAKPSKQSGQVRVQVQPSLLEQKENGEVVGSDLEALVNRKRHLQTKRIDLLIQLGKRQANLGVLLYQSGDKAGAYRVLNQAIESHRTADDDLGMARVSSNLAQLLIEDGRLQEAQELAQQTYTKLSQPAGDALPDPVSIQYATLTLGLLCFKQKKFQDACGWLQFTLQIQTIHSIIDAVVQETCFQRLESAFGALGNGVMARKYRGLHQKENVLKNVLFVLDCSGSMAGGSITRCRTSIKEIIGSYVEPEDRVCLITFSNKSKIIFPLTQRGYEGEAVRVFQDAVDHNTQPNGITAFFDAMSMAIQEFARVSAAALKAADGDPAEARRNNWLIALTDGEDNASSCTVVQVREQLQRHPCHLVIITVGASYDKAAIQMLIAAAQKKGMKGHHIETGSDSISQAFESVAKLITQQLNVETM